MIDMLNLCWLHGKPLSGGVLKAHAEDFIVTEDLGYSADGEGEHVLVRVRKNGCNTRFVADSLAKHLNIPAREVSFAGLKDRHAVTEQTFCLRVPGKEMPEFNHFSLAGCEILSCDRHRRKIRTGALAGNYFRLILRQITDQNATEQRLNAVKLTGVPNYFGAQRFGRDGHNLSMAKRWAGGEIQIRDRSKRSFTLSAARSAMFNQVTHHRLLQTGSLTQVMNGDILQLTHRGSWFVAEPDQLSELQLRVNNNELRITAPLPGSGAVQTKDQALQFEQHSLIDSEELITLLERERVENARRAMLVIPRDMNWNWWDPSTLELDFWLPAGSFATSVVREIILTDHPHDEITE